jgi:virulence factor Mce-like protein
MSANRPTGGAALVRLRIVGVVFLLVIGLLIALTIAIYQKAFTATVDVTLMADRAGNQLTSPADVKVRGVIVGETRGITSGSDGAVIELALDPDMVDQIPTNVSARLLPKTLFGEKFVDLVLPDQPSGRPLQNGDVIEQDRSETAREFATALDNLLPLLQTLKPEQVSTTLNALSTSLRGRGDRLGSNLVLFRDYLVEFNPEIEALGENFAGLADFADNLDAAAPDFLRLLDNLSEINRNLVDQEDELDTFLRRTADVSGTFESFVRENEQRFIALAAEGRLPLELFAEFAPMFPCLAQGIAESELFIGDTFGRLQPGLHITLEFIEDQGSYVPNADEPQYLERSGPDCFGLPRPDVPAGDFNFDDGFRDELPRETTGSPGDSEPSGSAAASSSSSSPFGAASFTTPAAQRSIVNAVVAPVLGTSVDRVPDVAHLLFGPVARGTAVRLSERSAS